MPGTTFYFIPKTFAMETNNNLPKGQEGTTGSDRGMQDKIHDELAGYEQKGIQQSDDADDKGATGTRARGIGDGGSTDQTNAAGSDGDGGRGSVAIGVEGSGGDSVSGVEKMQENKD